MHVRFMLGSYLTLSIDDYAEALEHIISFASSRFPALDLPELGQTYAIGVVNGRCVWSVRLSWLWGGKRFLSLFWVQWLRRLPGTPEREGCFEIADLQHLGPR